MKRNTVKINTANSDKLKEYRCLFAQYGFGLETSQVDLNEIDADPLSVIVHKASQVDERVLVEDTSLDLEGAKFGVNIRWLINALSSHVGAKAIWSVYLAYRSGKKVYVFKGVVPGIIVPAKVHKGFGFDPYFLPNGCKKTLSEDKPDSVNARALAVKAFVNDTPFAIKPVIDEWGGAWQNSLT